MLLLGLMILLAVGVVIFLFNRTKRATAAATAATIVAAPPQPAPVGVEERPSEPAPVSAASPVETATPQAAPARAEAPPSDLAPLPASPPPPVRTVGPVGDVFISYSSKDKPAADTICPLLERDGIRCWIAPRDVLPGQEWAESILHGISHARVFVLVFSAAANGSPQVRREVERAVHHEIPIIPFRVEEVVPNDSLEYFISTPHWLDAFTPPLEAHVKRLCDSIDSLLSRVQT
jgi:hypothetical protein